LIIGVDLDGVLTPISLYTESKFPWFCALWLVFVPPRRKMIQKLEIWQKIEMEEEKIENYEKVCEETLLEGRTL